MLIWGIIGLLIFVSIYDVHNKGHLTCRRSTWIQHFLFYYLCASLVCTRLNLLRILIKLWKNVPFSWKFLHVGTGMVLWVSWCIHCTLFCLKSAQDFLNGEVYDSERKVCLLLHKVFLQCVFCNSIMGILIMEICVICILALFVKVHWGL